jgi:hypothetical protein
MLAMMLLLHAIAFLVLVSGKCLRMISSYGKSKDYALVGMVHIGLPVLGTFCSWGVHLEQKKRDFNGLGQTNRPTNRPTNQPTDRQNDQPTRQCHARALTVMQQRRWKRGGSTAAAAAATALTIKKSNGDGGGGQQQGGGGRMAEAAR